MWSARCEGIKFSDKNREDVCCCADDKYSQGIYPSNTDRSGFKTPSINAG